MEVELDEDTIEGAETSEASFASNPVLDEFQTEEEQKRWLNELQASRKNRKTFDEEAVKTIQRYSGMHGDARTAGLSSNYNLFYANTELMKGQLFVRTPEPVVKRRFDDPEDDAGRVAADRLQRNLVYEVECPSETGIGFSEDFKAMIFDRLTAGIGVGWARLDEEEGEPEMRPVMQAVLDPVTGMQSMQPAMDQDGNPITEAIPGSEIKYQYAETEYVAWDDFYWAPSTVWRNCRWVCRRIPMNKKDVRARFMKTAGSEVLSTLTYEEEKDDGRASDQNNTSRLLKPKSTTEKTCDIMEIWDKVSRMVWWISESATVPLDVRKDTTDFPGFFPTPLPPLGRFNNSKTTPISDYSQVRALYLQLDDLQERATALTNALQLKWVYDATYKPLQDLYSTTAGLQGIPIENWAMQMQEKGGLKAAIEFAPLAEIAATYQEVLAMQETVKMKIFEIEGISDIMRGQSQAYDSSQATAAKTQFGTSRLASVQREVAEYAQKLIALKAHLICKFYQPQFILERSGLVTEADAPFIEPAMALLKENPMRHWRLLVSVDSIQDPSFNMQMQARTQMVQAVSAGLGQILPMAETNPIAAELGGHLLTFALASFKGGSQIEGFVDQALDRMRKAQGEQKPPKPTDAQVKAQSAMATQQLKSQTELQKAQIEAQTDLQTAQAAAQIDFLNAQIKKQSLDLQVAELRMKAGGLL